MRFCADWHIKARTTTLPARGSADEAPHAFIPLIVIPWMK
jgi:hypothetical protein